jgi:hypothetical protein
MSDLKRCARCKETKPKSAFYSGYCKECARAYQQKFRDANRPSKVCPCCDIEKPADAFGYYKKVCDQCKAAGLTRHRLTPARHFAEFNGLAQQFLKGRL